MNKWLALALLGSLAVLANADGADNQPAIPEQGPAEDASSQESSEEDTSRRRRYYIRGCRANPFLSHCGNAAVTHHVAHPAGITTCGHAVVPHALGGACSFMTAPLIPDGNTVHGYLQCVPVQPHFGCGVWMPRPCAPATIFNVAVQGCVHADGIGAHHGCLAGYVAHGACGSACGGICHSGTCCHAAPVAHHAIAHPAAVAAHAYGTCLDGYHAIGACGASCAHTCYHGTCCQPVAVASHHVVATHHGYGTCLHGYHAVGVCGHSCAHTCHQGTCCQPVAVASHHVVATHHGYGTCLHGYHAVGVCGHSCAHTCHQGTCCQPVAVSHHTVVGHPSGVVAHHTHTYGTCLDGYHAVGACGHSCAHTCHQGTCCQPLAVAHPAAAYGHPAAYHYGGYGGTCLDGYHAIGACGASCAHTCHHGTCCQPIAAAAVVAHPAAIAHPAVAAHAFGTCLSGYHAVGVCGTTCAHTCYHGTCCQPVAVHHAVHYGKK